MFAVRSLSKKLFIMLQQKQKLSLNKDTGQANGCKYRDFPNAAHLMDFAATCPFYLILNFFLTCEVQKEVKLLLRVIRLH
jgi:hypothetical protein